MTSRYDQLDVRARFFLDSWDEIDLAEMCASSETAAKRQQATIDRVRKIAQGFLHDHEDGTDGCAAAVLAALDGELQP
ncbi:hypothetical protein [Streptomyces sp. NPDC057910]|uniref:hypothetical protein n=1 Tax=Streptomyces sp. NPDC057910 TaxID=3346278 RepID=UPI0036E3636E